MYNKGERIIYGPSGVCEIADIMPMKFNENEEERLYYMLHPLSAPNDSIYVPVIGNESAMRRLLTKHEAEALLEQIADVDVLVLENSKLCDQKYRELVRSGDLNQIICVLKTSYFHMKDRMQQNKKVTAVDQKYFQSIKSRLVEELAMALDQIDAEVEDLLISAMDAIYSRTNLTDSMILVE